MDYMQELKMRLNADYECRIKQWRQDTITVIAAAKLIHDNLEDVVNRQDAKFLLNLNDPMSYIVNQWLAEHGEAAFIRTNCCTVSRLSCKSMVRSVHLELYGIS